MKAVVLAAGCGQRLRPFTEEYPKPLIPVLGKPLIEWIVDTLRESGIDEIVVVTGYLGSLIRKHLGRGSKFNVKIRYCSNPDYACGNGISLKMARRFFTEGEPFLLTMADHLIDTRIVKKALRSVKRKPLLCVDYAPKYLPQLSDATKVFVNRKGFIMDIGKNIPLWNAVDTGVFMFDSSVFRVIGRLARSLPKVTITTCVKYLSLIGKPLRACDVSGFLWFDIDTPEDLEFVETFLEGEIECQKSGTV
ncbi:MAG: phosphocholine cytidylyltransferase family protein [Candidatus Odinarchaeia archaeon]